MRISPAAGPLTRVGGPVLLGVDLTTGVKALAVDPSGGHAAPVASGYEQHPPTVGRDGRHEPDPEDRWRATVGAFRTVLRDVPAEPVASVGLTGHMPAVVFVDAAGTAVRPAKTWADRRAPPQADARSTHAALFAQRCANPVVPAFPVTRLRWRAEHEPHAPDAARRLVQPEDVLRHRLTGCRAVGACRRRSAAGAARPGSHRGDGSVTGAGAQATRPRAGTPVVAGAGDVACAALGAGAVDAARAYVNAGAAAQVMASTATPQPGRGFVFAQAVGTGHLTMASVYAAGVSVRWMRRDILDLAEEAGGALDAVAEGARRLRRRRLPAVPARRERSRPRRERPLRFPRCRARGRRAHLSRAVIEGVAFGCLDEVVRATGEAAGRATQLRSGGGGARRSGVLRDALAACATAPVLRLTVDASTIGAAPLAGRGGGVWATTEEAAATIRASVVERPDEVPTPAYRRSRERYRGRASCRPAHRDTRVGRLVNADPVGLAAGRAASPTWTHPISIRDARTRDARTRDAEPHHVAAGHAAPDRSAT